MPLWIRNLWASRRLPICWVVGHTHTKKLPGCTIWAMWCVRCYRDMLLD